MKKKQYSIYISILLAGLFLVGGCASTAKVKAPLIEGSYYFYHENEEGREVTGEAHYTFTATRAFFYSNSGNQVAEFTYTVNGMYIHLSPLRGDAKKEVLEIRDSATLLLRFELMDVVYIYKKRQVAE